MIPSSKNHFKNCTPRRIVPDYNIAIMHSHNFINQRKSKAYSPQFPASGFIHTKQLDIHSDEALPWSLDGEEADGGKDTHIEVLHESVNIILPKKRG